MTILEHANEIVYNRSEEKSRQYGPLTEGIERAAKIASAATGKDITARDVFMVLIALKLSRESYNKKYDNILDAIAYLAGMVELNKEEYDATR